MPNFATTSLVAAALSLGLGFGQVASAGADASEPSLLSVPVRFHQIAWDVIDAENHRLPDAPALATGVSHPNAAVRALALQSLGRIGLAPSLTLVLPALSDSDAAVRGMAAFAAGMIGGAEAIAALRLAEEQEEDALVRGKIALAVGRAGTLEDLAWLGARLSDARLPGQSRGLAAQAVGLIFLKSPAGTVASPELLSSLTALATTGGRAAIPAAFALARYSGGADDARVQTLIAATNTAVNPEARGFLARALGRTKADAARSALVGLLGSEKAPGVRVDIARTLVNFGTHVEVLDALSRTAKDESAQVRAQTFMTFEQLGAAAIDAKTTLLDAANSEESTWVRGAALTALAAVSPVDARPLVEAALATPWPKNSAALAASTYLGGSEDLNALLAHVRSENIAEAATAAGAAAGFADELLDQQARTPFLNALARPDLALTSIVAEAAGRRAWREFSRPLATVYGTFVRPDDVEAKVAVLRAIGLLGNADPEILAVLDTALADHERSVSLAAADAIKALTDRDVSAQVPDASIVHAVTPSYSALKNAAKTRLLVRTTRGKFLLQMDPSAPLTAANIVKLASQGFYNKLTMHRVVPHFVAQGGDPRGDGYGGPGYVIRDEASFSSHSRGAVGIATAGKDTGGCQFFVDHGSNLHLDGAYTVFAHVIRGMEVVDALEQGDVIKSVRRL